MARSVRGGSGIEGLGASRGKMGFDPWPAGLYAVSIKEADDSKPSKNGHWMLKLKYTIIGLPADVDFGNRDPLGKTAYESIYVPRSSAEKWHKQAVDKLRNRLNAAGVKVDEGTDWIADPRGVKVLEGKQYAVQFRVRDDDAGEPQQDYGKATSIADSPFAKAAAKAKARK